MPKSAVFSVGTTASVVVPALIGDQSVYLHSASGTLYIGGTNLTTANGYRMDNGDKTIIQNHGNAIYAVTSAGTANLSTLVIQK